MGDDAATLLLTMGLSFFLGGIATPEKLIRLYAMKDMRTIRRGVLFAIIMILALNLLVFVLALVAIVLFPSLPTGDLAMPMVATAVLPATLGAIMLAAITAAMMSTVDSLLIVAGSALSVDIYQNLINPNVSADRRLWVAGSAFSSSAPFRLAAPGRCGRGGARAVHRAALHRAHGRRLRDAGRRGHRMEARDQGRCGRRDVGGVAATFLWEVFGAPSVEPVLSGFLVSAALFVLVSLVTPPPPASAVAPYFDA